MFNSRILVFVIVIVSLSLLLTACAAPGQDAAEKWLADARPEFDLVAKYLAEYPYPDILIYEADGTMSLLLSEECTIDDPAVVSALKTLFSNGCEVVSKGEDENSIVFLMWRRFRDFGAGLAYAIEAEKEPTVVYYLTKLEELSADGWYYYEADYNEWRLQKTTTTTTRPFEKP